MFSLSMLPFFDYYILLAVIVFAALLFWAFVIMDGGEFILVFLFLFLSILVLTGVHVRFLDEKIAVIEEMGTVAEYKKEVGKEAQAYYENLGLELDFDVEFIYDMLRFTFYDMDPVDEFLMLELLKGKHGELVVYYKGDIGQTVFRLEGYLEEDTGVVVFDSGRFKEDLLDVLAVYGGVGIELV